VSKEIKHDCKERDRNFHWAFGWKDREGIGDGVSQVEKVIRDFWAVAPSNSLHLGTDEKAWAMPHVAIARGNDPLFLRNKEMVGSFLWTPEEAYALASPDAPSPACELRVIS